MISLSAHIAGNSVIEPGATIGANVHIGPFCLIAANVVIGTGTTIASHVVISGPTYIGRDNVIDQFSSIGEDNQDLKYAGEPTTLTIGDRNRIGKYATLHRGTVQGCNSTVIGNDNILLDNVHIAHDCIIGNGSHIGNNSGLAGHVELGDSAWLGSQCGVHQFCIIGANTQIADGSLVVQDVPPFVQASGNRARPIGLHVMALAFQAAGPHQQQILRAVYADMLLEHAKSLTELKLDIQRMSAEYPLLCLFNDFFARSTRGMIR